MTTQVPTRLLRWKPVEAVRNPQYAANATVSVLVTNGGTQEAVVNFRVSGLKDEPDQMAELRVPRRQIAQLAAASSRLLEEEREKRVQIEGEQLLGVALDALRRFIGVSEAATPQIAPPATEKEESAPDDWRSQVLRIADGLQVVQGSTVKQLGSIITNAQTALRDLAKQHDEREHAGVKIAKNLANKDGDGD